MRTRRPRTPWQALRPLAALTAIALLAGFAAPVAAAQTPSDRRSDRTTEPSSRSFRPVCKITSSALHGSATISTVWRCPRNRAERHRGDGERLSAAERGRCSGARSTPPPTSTSTPSAPLAGDRVYGGDDDGVLQRRLHATPSSASSRATARRCSRPTTTSGSFGGLSSAVSGTADPRRRDLLHPRRRLQRHDASTPYHLHLRVQSGAPTAEVEPNNDRLTATPLAASGWVSGTMTAPPTPTSSPSPSTPATRSSSRSTWTPTAIPPTPTGTAGSGSGSSTNLNQILIANDGSTTKPHAEAFFMTVKDAGTYYAYVDTHVGDRPRCQRALQPQRARHPEAGAGRLHRHRQHRRAGDLGPGVDTRDLDDHRPAHHHRLDHRRQRLDRPRPRQHGGPRRHVASRRRRPSVPLFTDIGSTAAAAGSWISASTKTPRCRHGIHRVDRHGQHARVQPGRLRASTARPPAAPGRCR